MTSRSRRLCHIPWTRGGLRATDRQGLVVPGKSLAEASRTSLQRGGKMLQRAETAGAVPAFGASLDDGRVSGEHLDVLTRTLPDLAPEVRDRFAEAVPGLLKIAEQSSPDEFGRAARDEARRLERDGDGLERLERQRRAIRCNSWVDKETGMGRWSLTWDPATWAVLETRLDTQVEARFNDTHPDGCPTDAFEKRSFLRAHALLALLDGKGARLGRPEIVVVEDYTDPLADGRPSLDWGVEVDLPREFLDALRPKASAYSVKVRNGAIIEAPGQLDLGRTTRLANRAQRRALRGLYTTCAIPGCRVRYSRTKLHHVVWWRQQGRTDLENLLPVCEIHHQTDPPRRLAHHPRTQPPTEHRDARRPNHDHRPTQATCGMIRCAVDSLNGAHR